MSPFDIYLAKFDWRGSDYERPWLLIRADGGSWLCFAISTKDYDSSPFEIRDDDADFRATGLNETSYIYDGESYRPIPAKLFRKTLGRLQGDLLVRFCRSSGFPVPK